jgi:hypothetical protein
MYQEVGALADSPPQAILHRGTGWGALERRRRERNGDRGLGLQGVVFDDHSLGEAQRPWVTLLETGDFPSSSPNTPPAGFVVGQDWLELLEGCLQQTGARQWEVWFHLGILRLSTGDEAGAQECWERSLALDWSPWACRNLAVSKSVQGDPNAAAGLMVAACKGAPRQPELWVECGQLLIEADRCQDWLDLVDTLPAALRGNGRIRLLEAQAALRAGRLAVVAAFLQDRIVPADLREGETSLSELWYAYQERRLGEASGSGQVADLKDIVRECPVPLELDFRIR